MTSKPTLEDLTKAWEENYDQPSQQFLRDLPLPTNADVLDIGAGGGSMTDWFSRNRSIGTVTALDVDVSQLSRLSGRSSIDIIKADIDEYHFQQGSFDLIFARGVLSVLPNAMDVLSKCRSWLRPGGRVVIEDFYFMNPDDAPTELGQKVLEAYIGASSKAGADLRMGRRLPSMLATVGFVEVKSSVRQLGPGQGASENNLMELRMRSQAESLVEQGYLTPEQIIQWMNQLDDPTSQDITTLGIRSWACNPK